MWGVRRAHRREIINLASPLAEVAHFYKFTFKMNICDHPSKFNVLSIEKCADPPHQQCPRPPRAASRSQPPKGAIILVSGAKPWFLLIFELGIKE